MMKPQDWADAAGGRPDSGHEPSATAPPNDAPEQAADWLKIAKDADTVTLKFYQGELRTRWERSLKHYQSKHAAGSKYISEQFKHRSRLFRPKTRAMVRAAEASTAAAFFSTQDVVSVTPNDDNNEKQKATAGVLQHLLQYRLTKTVPWFLIVSGATQDSEVYGVCVSRQSWQYETRPHQEFKQFELPDPVTGQISPLFEMDGAPVGEMIEVADVIHDRPKVDLLPPENVRVNPNASWLDPINSSPVVIVYHYMFAGDVKQRMRQGQDKTGQAPWYTLDDATIAKATARLDESDKSSLQTSRQPDAAAQRGQQEAKTGQDFDIVLVWEVFCRRDGVDHTYWTLGEHALLSDPIPTTQAFPHLQEDERPIVMGLGSIETHRTYPTSKTDMVADLQRATNDNLNQRFDNVRLALNPRWIVKRGKRVDIPSLLRSAPLSPIYADNPSEDLQVVKVPDVTASSYQEQNLLNVDFDDLTGQFSTGTVQSNRSLNETVGGMNLLAGSANAVAEYDLRVRVETWAEKVLSQLVRMEQHYETDETILSIAGQRAGLFEKFGISQIDDDLLRQEVGVTVNVGIGATNPMQQLQKLGMGFQMLSGLFGPALPQMLDGEEVMSEVFGKLGYRDGKRFLLDTEDPRIAHLMKAMEQMQQQMAAMQSGVAAKAAIAEQDRISRVETAQIDAASRVEVAEIGAASKLATAAVSRPPMPAFPMGAPRHAPAQMM